MNKGDVHVKDLPLASRQFYAEIAGLRLLCITLIVIYHIWLHKVSGGIDVFFVLTGFLTMLTMLYRIDEDGKVAPFTIVARIIKTQWLHAFIVIVGIMVMLFFTYPIGQWESALAHMRMTMMGVENGYLIDQATNYLAFDQAASPFQHFWSLAVQWQYAIAAAFVVAFVHIFSKQAKLPVRKTLLVVVVVLAAISFYASILWTANAPHTAYFHTLTRLWEILAGAAMALVVTTIKLHRFVARLAMWVSILMLVMTGILVPTTLAFPGYIAVIPVMAACLFLVSITGQTMTWGLFRARLTVWLSQYTYGLFLWHWPVLMMAKMVWQREVFTVEEGLLIIAVSLAFAVISHHATQLVQSMFTMRRYQFVSIVTFAIAVSVSVNLMMTQYIDDRQLKHAEAEHLMPVEQYPGAAVLTTDVEAEANVPLIPPMLNVRGDLPQIDGPDACNATTQAIVTCSFNAGAERPIIALVGGSHSGHWFPALEELAVALNFQLDTYLHDGCRFTNDDFNGQMTEACLAWNATVIEHFQTSPPDFIFTTATLNKRPTIPSGYIAQWQALEGYTHIIAVQDNPRMPHDVPDCIALHNGDARACHVERADVLPDALPWDVTDNLPSNVTFIETAQAFCDDTTCFAAAGNIIAYRDTNHITATYAKTLQSILHEPLRSVLIGTASIEIKHNK